MSDTMLRAVADELAIRNLIAELAQVSDEGTSDEYATLFAEDATWRLVGTPEMTANFPPRIGRARIKAGVEGSRAIGLGGLGSNARHVMSNIRIRVDGDVAEGRSYMTYLTSSDAVPLVQSFAVYEDRFIRTADGWKLHMRVVLPGESDAVRQDA